MGLAILVDDGGCRWRELFQSPAGAALAASLDSRRLAAGLPTVSAHEEQMAPLRQQGWVIVGVAAMAAGCLSDAAMAQVLGPEDREVALGMAQLCMGRQQGRRRSKAQAAPLHMPILAWAALSTPLVVEQPTPAASLVAQRHLCIARLESWAASMIETPFCSVGKRSGPCVARSLSELLGRWRADFSIPQRFWGLRVWPMWSALAEAACRGTWASDVLKVAQRQDARLGSTLLPGVPTRPQLI